MVMMEDRGGGHLLDDGDIDRGVGTRAVDLFVRHGGGMCAVRCCENRVFTCFQYKK